MTRFGLAKDKDPDIALMQIGDEGQEELLETAAKPLLENLRCAAS